jgi:hypothetical protein
VQSQDAQDKIPTIRCPSGLHVESLFIPVLRWLQEAAPDLCSPHEQQLRLLRMLVKHERQLQSVITTPLDHLAPLKTKGSDTMAELTHVAWASSPQLAAAFAQRFRASSTSRKELHKLLLKHCGSARVQAWPGGAAHFVDAAAAANQRMGPLATWAPTSVAVALLLLAGKSGTDAHVRRYVMRSMSTATDGELVFWLPQTLQALRNDDGTLAWCAASRAPTPAMAPACHAHNCVTSFADVSALCTN